MKKDLRKQKQMGKKGERGKSLKMSKKKTANGIRKNKKKWLINIIVND